MGHSLQELKPLKRVLSISGKDIELSQITLNKSIFFDVTYGGINSFYDKLEEDRLIIIYAIWELVVDKKMFDNSIGKFITFLHSSKESKVDIGKKLIRIFNDIVLESFPIVKNRRRQDDLNKIRETKADAAEACYAVYYDVLASRYGYTLETFYSLTLRQLKIILSVVDDKKYEELQIQAALLDKKLKERIKYETDITPEQEQQQEKQAYAALEELKRKYESRKN